MLKFTVWLEGEFLHAYSPLLPLRFPRKAGRCARRAARGCPWDLPTAAPPAPAQQGSNILYGPGVTCG